MSIPSPAQVMERLDAIDRDMAERLPRLEAAAQEHFLAKREKEKKRAEVFLTTEGTVAERNASADRLTAETGKTAEAEYEAIKAVVRVLEARSTIGAALLKAQSRGA